jgi:putative tryptophan/tyrosine transport system substrate-binding protein
MISSAAAEKRFSMTNCWPSRPPRLHHAARTGDRLFAQRTARHKLPAIYFERRSRTFSEPTRICRSRRVGEISLSTSNSFPLMPYLVRRQVAVIATVTSHSTFAAKAATTSIPIIFSLAEDPVRLGLIASIARPGGNATGINILSGELVAKRLELLRELVPGAARVAVLVNPANATSTETTVRDVELAARTIGLQIQVLNASTSREIDAAFAALARERPDALLVATDTLFTTRRVQMSLQAMRHAIPATYSAREVVEAGGLMSYGSNLTDALRQAGAYTGRILKGAKPADLPVVQASKFELVINHQTARMLGLTVPDKLLVAADEVIE